MNEERVQILQMLQDGKISVDEAARLLEAAEIPPDASVPRTSQGRAFAEDDGDEDDEPMPHRRRGIRFQGTVMTNMHFTAANLAGVDFAGQDLQGFDFTGANLQQANFRDADLTGANLTGANLAGADLRNANLSNAALTGAALRNTQLEGANLTGADLTGADLRGYRLRNGVLTPADDSRGGGRVAGDTIMFTP